MTTASDALQESTWEWLDKTINWLNNEPWWEYRRLDPRRKLMLTASEMGIIMGGNPEKIDRLWRVKVGYELPEDLSKNWDVVRGCVMEGPIIHWYELRSGTPVTRRQEFCIHPHHDWFGCTLDGCDESERKCVVEAKAPAGREPLEVVIERAQPQLQSQMEITGAQQVALCVSMGGSEPIVEFIPRDAEYARELVARGEQFMQYVRNKICPVELPAIPAPIVAFRTYDMVGNNLWASQATAWLENKDAADLCKDAEKTLKSLVPADGRKAVGHGVVITRDRAGRLSLRSAAETRGRS